MTQIDSGFRGSPCKCRKIAREPSGPGLATKTAENFRIYRVASAATSAVPANANAAQAMAVRSQEAAQAKSGEDFQSMLAQETAAEEKSPGVSLPQPTGKAVTMPSTPPSAQSVIWANSKSGTQVKSSKTDSGGSKTNQDSTTSQTQVASNTTWVPPHIADPHGGLGGANSPSPDDGDDDSASPPRAVDGKGGNSASPSNAAPSAQPPSNDDGENMDPEPVLPPVDSKNAAPAPSGGIAMPTLPGETAGDKLSALVTAGQNLHHVSSPQTAQAPQHQANAQQSSQQQASSQQQTGGQQSNSQNAPNHGDGSPHNGQAHDDQSSQASNNSAPSQQANELASGTANAVTQPASPPSPFTATNLPGGIGVAPGQPVSAVTLPSSIQVVPAGHDTSGAAASPDLNALAIGIAAKSLSGSKQFDISLDPPELGRVDVRLTVDNAGKAQAHLAADKPETLQMLQRDSSSLERALKDSGIQLSNNGLQFSLKGQGGQGNGAQSGSGRSQPLALAAAAQTLSSAPIASSYGLAYSRAGVDIRV
jgi:flagellar hook-length control protein FliK